MEIQFNALPEVTRRRFVAATQGQGAHQPIAVNALSWGNTPLWALAGLAALWLLRRVITQGFGMHNGFPTHIAVVLYTVGVIVLALASLRIVRHVRADSATPYVRGEYLFALQLVRATSPDTLEIISLLDTVHVTIVREKSKGVTRSIHIVFHRPQGPNVVFDLGSDSMAVAKRIVQTWDAARNELHALARATDTAQLAARDVFFEARASAVWADPATASGVAPAVGDAGPSTAPLPVWLRRTLAGALLAGLLIPIPMHYVRDAASCHAYYGWVEQQDRVYSFRKYAAECSIHRGEALRRAADLSGESG